MNVSGVIKHSKQLFLNLSLMQNIGHDIILEKLPKEEYFEEVDVVKMEIKEEGIKTE